MRKVMSLRLSDEARTLLPGLMQARGLSAGRVVEELILEASEKPLAELEEMTETGRLKDKFRRNTGPLSTPKPTDTPAKAERYAKAVGRSVKTTLKSPPQVQDISATKQVLRRRTNPMTGKPFGPVPKGKQ